MVGHDLRFTFVLQFCALFHVNIESSKYFKMNVSEIDIPGALLNGRLPTCEPTGLVLMRLVYSREALCRGCMRFHLNF